MIIPRILRGDYTLCLDNVGLLIPDLAFIGYFGDGPRMALSGYSEITSSGTAEYVIEQEFNMDGTLSVETELCTEGVLKDMREKYEYSYSN